MRTAVGLRCPVCAQGVTVRIGRPRRWPFVVAAVVVVALVAAVLLTRGGSDSDDGSGDPIGGTVERPAGGPASGYRVESRPTLGYSVEVPVNWQAAPDNTDTTLSYAEARPAEGSLRVTVNPTDAPLPDLVARLVDQLRGQGGVDFVQTATQISGVPAVKLDYRFPTSPTPGSTMASRSSYLVVRDGKVFSFQLATTDPASKELVFAYMASKFTLL